MFVVFVGIGIVWGLAVDTEGNKLYLTSYNSKTVEVSNLDGSARTLLISSTGGNPRGIAVHRAQG